MNAREQAGEEMLWKLRGNFVLHFCKWRQIGLLEVENFILLFPQVFIVSLLRGIGGSGTLKKSPVGLLRLRLSKAKSVALVKVSW